MKSNMQDFQTIADCDFGENIKIISPYNLYGCKVGDNCFIGPFVEIQKNASIGKNTRISSHSFVCEGVHIGDDCFIAHGVMFTNDKFNRDKFELAQTIVGNNVKIGSNSTILPVKIGDNVVVGAGSVVTKDIPAGSVVAGNPAKIIKRRYLK